MHSNQNIRYFYRLVGYTQVPIPVEIQAYNFAGQAQAFKGIPISAILLSWYAPHLRSLHAHQVAFVISSETGKPRNLCWIVSK